MDHLTSAEWSLMECLWSKAPCTGREAVEYMKQSVGWSRSTTLTMLRRMSEKGIILCMECDGLRTYSPCIPREDASMDQTKSFLDRVYNGSLAMMVSAFTKNQPLTQQEIDALYAILEEAKSND